MRHGVLPKAGHAISGRVFGLCIGCRCVPVQLPQWVPGMLLRQIQQLLCGGSCRLGSQFEGKYSDSVKAAFVYPSSNYEDDLAWGASWLFRKTGEAHFLQVRTSPPHTLPTWMILCGHMWWQCAEARTRAT